MKILNTRRINEKIMKYIELEELNGFIGVGVNNPIGYDGIVFENYNEVMNCARDFQNCMKSEKIMYSEDESLIAVMINAVVNSVFELPNEELPFPPYIMDDMIKESRIFKRGEIENNGYLKNIHFNDERIGNFELSHGVYSKYQLMMYNIPILKYNSILIPRIGTFDHRFEFPYIKENDEIWMSVTPNEIITMEKPIADAKGNVLTLGCGMGYYAYMVAEKEDVKHVTIIEKEPDVISLFIKYILPQFSHKEKITIIQADALDYMKELNDNEYDYCFADIWRYYNDIIPYIKLKKICSKFKNMNMSYWIEDSLLFSIATYVHGIIEEEYEKNKNNCHEEFIFSDNLESEYVYIKNMLKDIQITKPEHVDYFWDYNNIERMIGEFSEK